jgi:CTP synthase (UTP-ammonia lyase)
MASWHDFLSRWHRATREVHVALVGKYDLQDAYKSIRESLNLAGIYSGVKVKPHFVSSEDITEENVAEKLDGMAGVVPFATTFYETSGFAVTNLSLRATKDIKVTDSFSIPIFGQVTGNPCSQKAYLVLGFTLQP